MKAPDRRTDDGDAGALPRVVLVVALLVVATLGAAAREGTHFSPAGLLNSKASPGAIAFGVGVVVAACLALAALAMMLSRRDTRPAGGGIRTGRPVRVVLAGLLIATALAVLALEALFFRHPSTKLRLHLHRAPPPPGHSPALLLVLVALTAAAALVWRWRSRGRAGAGPAWPGEQGSPLAAAVTAGSAAFGAVTDARQAIIACYAAMEEALAAAGSPRRAADTPEEVLGRAHRDGTLRTPAAAALTDLFREARFSSHRLGDADRDAAELALGDIGRALGGQR